MTSFTSLLRTMKACSSMCATHTHDELSPFSYMGSMGKKNPKDILRLRRTRKQKSRKIVSMFEAEICCLWYDRRYYWLSLILDTETGESFCQKRFCICYHKTLLCSFPSLFLRDGVILSEDGGWEAPNRRLKMLLLSSSILPGEFGFKQEMKDHGLLLCSQF